MTPDGLRNFIQCKTASIFYISISLSFVSLTTSIKVNFKSDTCSLRCTVINLFQFMHRELKLLRLQCRILIDHEIKKKCGIMRSRPNLRRYSAICLGVLRKPMENLSSDSLSPHRHLSVCLPGSNSSNLWSNTQFSTDPREVTPPIYN
jgi:hypothetical protein